MVPVSAKQRKDVAENVHIVIGKVDSLYKMDMRMVALVSQEVVSLLLAASSTIIRVLAAMVRD